MGGEMRVADLRHAAMSLLAPLLLAILHQRELGGTTVRQMDLETFMDDHAAAFVRAYAVDAVAPSVKGGSRAAAGRPRRSGTRSRR